MFAEWTNPHDIDNYYDGLDGLFKKISTAPSSNTYQQMPKNVRFDVKPETPTGPLVKSVAGQEKSTFEVTPDSIFADNHPVGRQPPYNVLRSGAPKESYYDPGYYTQDEPSSDSSFDWIWIVLIAIIVVLIGLLLQARQQAQNANTTIQMLFALYSQQQPRR